MNPMFSSLGVLNVDHYAVTTRDLNATLRDFLSIPNAKLIRGPGENPSQKVNYAFVELNGMGVVEILSPLSNESPIHAHIKSGGGAYHLCYAVVNLDQAISTAQKDFKAKLVVDAKPDKAFDGRRVAFLVHPIHGLFELLEASPVFMQENISSNTRIVDSSLSTKFNVLDLYNKVMGTSESDIQLVSMENCVEWNSFKHLLFIMKIEEQFEINILPSVMAQLTDLVKIQSYLENK